MDKNDFSILGRDHATIYENIIHDPSNPRVQASYDSLINALIAQWHALQRLGYRFVIGGDAYSSSRDMFDRVHAEHRLIILDTTRTMTNMPDDHPMLTPVDETAELNGTDHQVGLTANDVFRGVHDYLGHYIPRNQFGPIGEYHAWLAHMSSLPRDSWMALFCETRGQNAWTNYALDHESLPIASRPFPLQKSGVVDMNEVLSPVHMPDYFN